MTDKQIRELWEISFGRSIRKFRLDSNDAEDIASIVVEKFFKKNIAEKLEEKQYKSWIITTTDNDCIDHLKE